MIEYQVSCRIAHNGPAIGPSV